MEHDYSGGKCKWCDNQQENHQPTYSGMWVAQEVVKGTLYTVRLNMDSGTLSIGYGDDVSSLDATFRDELINDYYGAKKYDVSIVDGVYYYTGRGDGGKITYTVNGNAISVKCDDYLTLTLERVAENQLTIRNVQGASKDIVGIDLIRR